MFIKITTHENETIYINENEIRHFKRETFGKDKTPYTVLDLKYGTMLAVETPEELFELLNK